MNDESNIQRIWNRVLHIKLKKTFVSVLNKHDLDNIGLPFCLWLCPVGGKQRITNRSVTHLSYQIALFSVSAPRDWLFFEKTSISPKNEISRWLFSEKTSILLKIIAISVIDVVCVSKWILVVLDCYDSREIHVPYHLWYFNMKSKHRSIEELWEVQVWLWSNVFWMQNMKKHERKKDKMQKKGTQFYKKNI